MFQCGFYEKEITPPLGCAIPGYFNLRQASNVKDRLFARALVIEDGKTTAAILSVDCCTVDNDLVAAITGRVKDYTGIPEENVLVCYTHTHTGGPRYGAEIREKQAEVEKCQEGYFSVFSNLLADCVTLAYLRLTECALTFGKGEVDGISFCRNYFMKNSTPRTNPPRTSPEIEGPAAETDNELPVLFVRDGAGKPMGAIVSFACHPDCVSGTEYTGDYISELSKQLKKAYGEEFVTVFMLGTCGDINHFDVSRESDAPDHFRMMGQKIAGEAIKTVACAAPVEGDTLTVKKAILDLKRREISEEKIAEAKHVIATVKEIPGIKIAADGTDPDQYNLMMSKSLINFLNDTPETMQIPLHFVRIGNVKLYTFPSEVYCCYGKMVKEQAGTPNTFVGTLCGASWGYVPSLEMLPYDTIYEARPGANRLEKEAGNKMVKKLLEMGKE